VIDTSLALPAHLYPLFAPLPLPIASHLVTQEYRRSRRKAVSMRPAPEQVWWVVEEQVRRARTVAYEYMHPFVLVDKRRSEQGLPRAFPSAEWLLDTLATYTPEGKRNAEPTLDYWQKKGLLRRDKPRGQLDLMSVAALLIARIAEEEHQRNWLPSKIREEESDWWCYGQAGPTAPAQPTRLPLAPTLPAATLLWTPWLGAAWEGEWRVIGNKAFRWAGAVSSEHDLEAWDPSIAATIMRSRSHALIGQETIQVALLQEASRMILEQQAERYQHTEPPDLIRAVIE
jgi:hypothetical protein